MSPFRDVLKMYRFVINKLDFIHPIKGDSLKQKERYFSWKEKTKDGIPNLTKENSVTNVTISL